MYPPDRFREILRHLLDPAPAQTLVAGEVASAVLIPVLAQGPELRVVFTKRTDTLSRHAGEISFPGGLADGDEMPAATALREAEEELGLKPSEVELLGALPPVHTHVSGIMIVPFVGMLWRDPAFTPNADEIDQVLEFPLRDLVSAGSEQEFEHEGQRFHTFVYDMEGHVIWGATARILWSFIDLLRATPLEATPDMATDA
jgi:8-oxo-dGTP pyrophosphatase MutT (NUDIX family)